MTEFVHLHNHSDFSLLDGAADVDSMVARAKELGMPGLALTDHGTMFGAIKFYKSCRASGLNPIVGSEFYVAGSNRRERAGTENGNKYWHLVLLAENETGYRNLLKLSSISYTEGFYYKPRIDDEVLARHKEGLIASSACLGGEIPALLLAGQTEAAERKALFYKELFGPDRYYLELQDHGIPEQKIANRALVALARKHDIPLVATNDMHYLMREDAKAHDVLLCIGTGKKISEQSRMRFSSSEFYLKSPQEMESLFGDIPESLSNTLRINEMSRLDINFPGPLLPDYSIPEGFSSPEEYLRHLTRQGLAARYSQITPEIHARAEYELGVIISMKFTGYFLIVWDFIHWAKEHDIPVGPGRGSGAGSIVAYALKITDIEPLSYNLLFERFLNPDRISMPDFDVDFCFERRGEVIDYVTRKYGAERVGQIITFGTLKAKAVIKDVARAMELSFDEANSIGKLIPEDPKMTLKKALEEEPRLKEMASDDRYRELFEVARVLENRHRHSSVHAAGIVIGKSVLTDYVPLYKDPKTGVVSTQYTMDLLEDCGLVKMDFLGLKTLTLIKHTLDLLKRRNIHLKEEDIPEDDEKTFRLLGEGKSRSIFQFESSGMQTILKDAKPTSIADLIALNALYRPGPMAYIPQFVNSKWGRTPITYPHPSLEKILKETYGVIVYQEQVMQVAQEIAGYSLGRADLLRRAMGKKKKEVLEKEKAPFIEGAVARGYSAAKAAEIFEILVPFAGYGFNKSHAAAYSVVAYRTAYLKANYPAEFMAANLTNEINSTDKLTEYIAEARSMGLEVLPPSVNHSEAMFTVVDGKIVYGLLGIKGIGDAFATLIVETREKLGPYQGFLDFIERLGTQSSNRKSLECLIQAGCFDSSGQSRQELVANIERAVAYIAMKENSSRYGQASLFDDSGEEEYAPFAYERLEEYPRSDLLRIEKELLGFYFTGHPMDEFREVWRRCSDADFAHPEHANPDKTYTVVAMLRDFREILTKAGKRMAFGTLEDYSGSMDLVVFADMLEKNRERFVIDRVLCMRGKIDLSRGNPAFKLEEFADPATLRERSWKEVHIRLEPSIFHPDALESLRDFLFECSGPGQVYIHVPEVPRGARSAGPESLEDAGEDAGAAGEDECVTEAVSQGGDPAVCSDAEASTSLVPNGFSTSHSLKKGPEARVLPKETIVKVHPNLGVATTETTIERLSVYPGIAEVWRD